MFIDNGSCGDGFDLRFSPNSDHLIHQYEDGQERLDENSDSQKLFQILNYVLQALFKADAELTAVAALIVSNRG